ncbi:hypothetical protein [Noviherbaspirillum autotrophicum]|nr:hypothetical protein [Noviherbaspirillum autotrophicum]
MTKTVRIKDKSCLVFLSDQQWVLENATPEAGMLLAIRNIYDCGQRK